LGMMQLYETYYANYSLFDGSRYDKFRTIDVQKIWIYGMGLEGGYKFIIKNHLFIEGMFGLPYGFAAGTGSIYVTKHPEVKSKRFLNLMRMELSVGYNF
ncbi:MAG: DUF3575 domain-containing protein, partial [Bacteroidia bacterium]|nr:DUF3575 domain-containing protein [Bacteroidia bacterium]